MVGSHDIQFIAALAAVVLAAAAAKFVGFENPAGIAVGAALTVAGVWHVKLLRSCERTQTEAGRAERLDRLRTELLEEREHHLLRLRALELTNRITPSEVAWLTIREVEILAARGLLHVDEWGFSVLPTRATHHELHSARARKLNERLDASRLGDLGRDAEAWPVCVGRAVEEGCVLLEDLRSGGEAATKIAAKIEQVVWRRAR